MIESCDHLSDKIQQPLIENAVSVGRKMLTRDFSDADREMFLDDCFEQIAACFKSALSELESRETAVQTKFKRVDANQFTAVIFQNGSSCARCKIVLGGGGMGLAITYSGNDDPLNNSYNESLSVKADIDGLCLKPMGMPMIDLAGRQRMNEVSSFEYLWELFTRNRT